MGNINSRVQKHRDNLRHAGLRPIQIWVPDTRAPGFAEECRRQSLIIRKAEEHDEELQEFLDMALDDVLEGWEGQ